jgi:hypothetical protein
MLQAPVWRRIDADAIQAAAGVRCVDRLCGGRSMSPPTRNQISGIDAGAVGGRLDRLEMSQLEIGQAALADMPASPGMIGNHHVFFGGINLLTTPEATAFKSE